MKILVADYIYTPEGFKSGLSVAFDKQIEAVDTLDKLLEKFPGADVTEAAAHSVIYPGFINTHVHLEFSANKTSLAYGSFMPWLDSVIANRDTLMQCCDNKMMRKECDSMLHSGITAFGAISSFGTELEVCEQTPQKVVFFNELIGSNAMYADMLYGDFMERVKASSLCDAKSRVTPAIAIHSPYSVHPVILEKAVTVAKQNNFPLSAHFLESQSEREWLEKGSGEFKGFFEKYFNTSTPVSTIKEFLHAFDTYPTHFVHAVQADDTQLKHLKEKGHSIAHCPRSNRYLGCGRLAIEKLKDLEIPYTIATDGLSSNDSLNIFDEFRATLMLHHQAPIQKLANKLIKANTQDAAEILGLNCGKIEAKKDADLVVITLPDAPQTKEEIALWSIIHTQEVASVYIEGEKYV